MLGTIKEKIIESTTENEDLLIKLLAASEVCSGVISAIEIKAYSDCTINVNGSDFIIDKGEILSLPYNYMKIESITAVTAGVKLKIRYLIE